MQQSVLVLDVAKHHWTICVAGSNLPAAFMKMIYTVGHRESYERYFKEQKHPRKKGRTKGYNGGSVWKTLREAKKFAKNGYAVYGVLADWDKDTAKSKEGGNWHDLLKSSELVRLNK